MKNHGCLSVPLCMLLVTALWAPTGARAGVLNVDFTLIADEDTLRPPIGIATFNSLFGTPAISGTTVAFRGLSASTDGVYKGQNSTALTRIADGTTAVPGGVGNVDLASNQPSISGGAAALMAEDSGTAGDRGVYTGTGGALGLVADENTTSPSTATDFTNFSSPAISGSQVVFWADSSGTSGIYEGSVGGGVSIIADEGDSVPSSAFNFAGFSSPPAVSGSFVAFEGIWDNGREGIYRYLGTSGTKIADEFDTVPGTGGDLFTSFQGVSISGATVAFAGIDDNSDRGIFTGNGVSLSLVANESTAIPEGTGTFADFDLFSPAISGSSVAFIGIDGSGDEGIYVLVDGELSKVVDFSDTLGGLTPNDFKFGPWGLDGNSLAFYAGFTNGDTAIYRADFSSSLSGVPEPSILVLLGAGTLMIVGTYRRKKRSANAP